MERGVCNSGNAAVSFPYVCQRLMNVVVLLCQYAHFEHSWTKFRNVNKTIMPARHWLNSRTCSIQTRTKT